MTKTRRVAAMMMAAAMGTSMIGVIPAAAEEERETLKLALTQSSMVTDYENNYFTKYLEDKLNINIEFYMLPADSAEARTKVNLMATSNEDLPDVMITDNFLMARSFSSLQSLHYSLHLASCLMILLLSVQLSVSLDLGLP